MIIIDDVQWSNAEIAEVKHDLFWVLDRAPKEARGVLAALQDGKVNGSVFIDDERQCGCLIGTVALLQGTDEWHIPNIGTADATAAQEWFGFIDLDDTPEDNEYSAHAARWIEEWLTAAIVAETAKGEASE